jgi:hypothetical protein
MPARARAQAPLACSETEHEPWGMTNARRRICLNSTHGPVLATKLIHSLLTRRMNEVASTDG